MSRRPTQDELKLARDGQLSAGRPAPACVTCEKPFETGDKIAGAFVDGTRDGRRTGRRIYWHDTEECKPW